VGDGKRVDRVEDFLNVGDKVEVSIADIDNRGKIYLDKVRPEGAEAPAEAPAAAAGGEGAEGAEGGRPPREDRGPRGEGGGGEPRRRRQRPTGDRN
jgi:polyribonucleotide nucleotidyltransferase